MSQVAVSEPFHTVVSVVTVDVVPQPIFNYSMKNGRIMLIIYDSVTDFSSTLGGIDLVIIDAGAKSLINYGNFFNTEVNTDLPLNLYLKPTYGYDLVINYDLTEHVITVANSSAEDDTPTLQFVALFISGEGSIGPKIQSVDSLVENVIDAGINISGAVTINKGEFNLGTVNTNNFAINIGTDASGARAITMGNTGSGNSLTLRGNIETPNPIIGTVTYNDSADHEWSNNANSVKRIGNMCFISIRATVSAINTLIAGASYSFVTITPSDFNAPTLVTATAIIETASMTSGIVFNDAGTGVFHIVFPNDVVSSSSVDVTVSITYIK